MGGRKSSRMFINQEACMRIVDLDPEMNRTVRNENGNTMLQTYQLAIPTGRGDESEVARIRGREMLRVDFGHYYFLHKC